MGKIGNAIAGAWANVRAGFSRFIPFHLGACALAVLASWNLHDIIDSHVCFDWMRGIFWGMLAGVFTRLVADRCGKKRLAAWLSWAVTIGIAALGVVFWTINDKEARYYWEWMMVFSGTSFALFAASVAVLYSEINENALFSKLWVKFLIVFGSALLVFGGLAGCYAAFDALIVDLEEKWLGDLYFFTMIAAAPICFMSVLPGRDAADDGSTRAGGFLFRRVLPVTVLLLAILYAYLVKILIIGRMPSGYLNWVGSVALAIYVFFWLALRGTEGKFSGFVIRRGWAFLVPVLVAQILAVTIRLRAYGLTAERYSGVIVLAIGIYALVLAAFDRRHVSLFWVFAVAGLVFTLTPLNISDIPVRNQESRLRAALERAGCVKDGVFSIPENVSVSDEDAEKIAGAWDYLSRAHVLWYKPEFAESVREATKNDLPNLLSIDPKFRRGRHSGGAYHYVSVDMEGERIPVGHCESIQILRSWCDLVILKAKDGDSASQHAQVEPQEKRWILKLEKHGEFDVTEHVEKLFAATGIDIQKPEGTKTAPPELFRWELKPGLSFAFRRLHISRNDSCPPDISCDGPVLLFADREAPEASDPAAEQE